MIQMTYHELKVLRALVKGERDELLANGVMGKLDLDAMQEKLDAAARRLKQREYQKLNAGIRGR